ncbi:MAG: DegT/DnrJ/EryC1/StrS family aminotransferase [Propionicimonas sp.]
MPELHVPFAAPDITDREIQAAIASMRSGWLTTGPEARAFEAEFASFLGDDLHAIAVNSATAGLHLAVEALGLGPGDEVLVPTWTFTATAEVVRYVGATPVLVDIDPVDLNIDLQAAEAAITERTRAMIPVHFAGRPLSRTRLADFASRHGLAVIEDAAHAFPVYSESRLVGSGASEAVVFSFYASKTITTGEGGMLVTPSDRLAERARIMRLHGISRDAFDRYRSTVPAWRYEVVAPGFKYNMTDTAASIGRVQLARAEEMRLARERIADRYTSEFGSLPLELPAASPEERGHSWHLYVIRLHEEAGVSRDDFIQRMSDQGIGTSVHFIPLHMHPYWRESLGVAPGDFPTASTIFERVVSIPIFSAMSASDIDRVVTGVRRALGG